MSTDVGKHFSRLKEALEHEQAEEIEQFRQEFLQKTPEEREKLGKALLNVRLIEIHYSPAGHTLLSFRYVNGRAFPVHSLDIGDVVSIAPWHEDRLDLPIGTVYEREPKLITVAMTARLPPWVEEEKAYELNMCGDRATFKKAFEALRIVSEARHDRIGFFRDLSLGEKKVVEYDPVQDGEIQFFNKRLNASQKQAVELAQATKDIALVHGPPGTGKTTALIEIIKQATLQEKFVFATAPSNTACDNLLEGLVEAGVKVVRLGHPARIMKRLRQHTFDYKLMHHPQGKQVAALEQELRQTFKKRQRQKERGGLDRFTRQEIGEHIDALKKTLREINQTIYKQVLQEAEVMVGTLTSGMSPMLSRKTMNLVVMDEASQATEPMAWIPILRAEKVIMAGDHFQLPPTVKSKKAEELGLSQTLFERYHKTVPPEWKCLLKTQYRMHENIMHFSSKKFYEGKLEAHEEVKYHCLADLSHVQDAPETQEVFLYLDTAGKGFEEQLEEGSESRYNEEEAKVVLKCTKDLLKLGLKPREIAIVSPYSAQVRWLEDRVPHEEIEVDSVDGFQGREKEAVILSLVRSNVEGELGFLVDIRRMNVAMTRARRKLVVIGDSATLSSIPFYRDFIAYAESISAYRSLWEIA